MKTELIVERVINNNKVKRLNFYVTLDTYARYYDLKHRLQLMNPNAKISEIFDEQIKAVMDELDKLLTKNGY